MAATFRNGQHLRVGMLCYPMLFQNEGGLQVQIRETVDNLRALGIDASLIETTRDKLADFDIIHIFAVTQGNVKLVEQARAKGCRVVVSGLLNPALVPEQPWRLAAVRLLDKLIGRLSRYKVGTDYLAVRKALAGADQIIALSGWERRVMSRVYGADPARVSVIPNGVSAHFYQADAADFHARFTVPGPFVFCPGQISPWKNQLSLVKAMVGTGIGVVLAGPVHPRDQAYFDSCLAVPDVQVTYLGNLERTSPALSGAYAAAVAVVLPSKAESGPLVALEALAAGTPAIITVHNGLDMPLDGRCLQTVAPFDVVAIRQAVLAVRAAAPDPAACRAAVASMSWSRVAQQIAAVYER